MVLTRREDSVTDTEGRLHKDAGGRQPSVNRGERFPNQTNPVDTWSGASGLRNWEEIDFVV